MKKLFILLSFIAIFASCKKDPDMYGYIEVQNSTDLPAKVSVYTWKGSSRIKEELHQGAVIREELEIGKYHIRVSGDHLLYGYFYEFTMEAQKTISFDIRQDGVYLN